MRRLPIACATKQNTSGAPPAPEADDQETSAATVVQSAAKGKLVRNVGLAGFAVHEQQDAVDRLGTQRHLADPGIEILPPSRHVVLGDNQGRNAMSKVRTVHC